MKNSKHEKRYIPSIEDASVLRKFTILFLLMSIIPTTILWYLYIQLKDHGTIQMTPMDFNLTLIFVVLGVMVGYMAMRNVLKKLIDLNIASKNALKNILKPEKVQELGDQKNEIAALAMSFSEITKRLEENVKTLELAKRTLNTVMSKVGEGITSMQNIDSFLELIMETVTEALSGTVGVLWLIDEQKGELWVKSSYGVNYTASEPVRLKIDQGTTMYSVIKSKNAIMIPKLSPDLTSSKEHSHLFDAPMVAAPLIIQDNVLGVITVSGRKIEGNYDQDELTLLYNLASQTAVAIENSRLSSDIEKTYFETISALALAVDARDKYSRGHLDRVANYCIQMGKKLGLEEEDLSTLRDAARLHDIGKIGIPDVVLKKKSSLNNQEWELMRKHPEIGESIIKPIRSLNHLCDIIRHHHEKLDGSGYPDGLSGGKITPLVRILTVADIYDALTTDRSYRKKMTKSAAYGELRKMKDTIDQDIVEAFIESLEA